MDLPAFVFPLLRVVRIPAAVKWHLARVLNTHFLLGVAGVVRDDEGRLLLFKHTYRKRYPWGLPGGWMSRGESPLEGLKREIYEESKLEIVPERLLLIGTSRDRPKMEFIVSARVVGGSFTPSPEVSEHGWFAADALPPLAMFHRLILARLETHDGALGWYDAPWTP